MAPVPGKFTVRDIWKTCFLQKQILKPASLQELSNPTLIYLHTRMTYESVLEQYFQPEPMAQNLYKLYVEEGVSSREDPFLQQVGGILGRDQFIKEVRRKAKVKKHREIPDSRAITRGLKFEDVLNAVAKRFGIDKSMIKEVGQKGNQARKVSFYILRQFTDISNEKIGKYFGIGYTAVSQARSRIKKEMQSNRRLRKIIQDLERELVGKK